MNPARAPLRSLAYALKPAPLILVCVFSLLTVLAFYAGIFGIPLALLLFFGFTKYAFVLLDLLAEGVEEPPVLTIEMLNLVDGGRTLVALALVIGLFFGTNAATNLLGPITATILGLLAAALLPAIIAVQAATGSIPQSLNPLRFIGLAIRLRQHYLVIVVMAIALFGLCYFALRLSVLPFVLRIAALLYSWLSLFALIGAVLRERREEIGLEDAHAAEPEELDQTARIATDRERLIDSIYAEWRGGARRNAWDTLTIHLGATSDRVAELQWIYDRGAQWPDVTFANRLAQDLIVLYLDGRRNGPLLDLIRARLHVDPDFRPLRALDLVRVVQIARNGDRRIARAMLKDFERLFPRDALPKDIDALRAQLDV